MNKLVLSAVVVIAVAAPAMAQSALVTLSTDFTIDQLQRNTLVVDWNRIPDISFECEEAYTTHEHVNAVLSHKSRELLIDGKVEGPLTRSLTYYTNGQNRFGNMAVILVVSSVSGPNWQIDSGGGLITRDHVYRCIPD
jgi:hypothetical protein